MPGLGPVGAFLQGWNQADDAEKDRRLEEMRALTTGARDLSTATSQQSTMRREELLFPDLQRSQELKNMGADIANLQARSNLDVSRQTAPARVRQTQVDLNQSLLDYENGIITRDELLGRIQRKEVARERVQDITGETPGTLAMLGELAPGLQAQAAQQQNLFGLGATEKALQSRFNAEVVQAKIDSGLAPAQAQAEMLDIVNRSNLLAAQTYAARRKPYLDAISKAGTNERMKADALQKHADSIIKEIRQIEEVMSDINFAITLQDLDEAGFPNSLTAIIDPKNNNKEDALAGLEGVKNAYIFMLARDGINYHQISKPAKDFQINAPGLTPEANLFYRMLNEQQTNITPSVPNPGQIQQIPGMTQIPGIINLPEVGTPTTTQPGATSPATTTPATPQGWGALDVNKILEAYGTLGANP